VPIGTRLEHYLHRPLITDPLTGDPQAWFMWFVYASSALLVIFAIGCPYRARTAADDVRDW